MSGKAHSDYVKVQPSNATSFTLSKLSPDTAYSFAIRAYNRLGKSKLSAAVDKATLGK